MARRINKEGLKQSWKEHFDERVCKFGASFKSCDYADSRSFLLRQKAVLELINENHDKIQRILDAGCGPGLLSCPLLEKKKIFGIDISDKMLKVAQRAGFSVVCGDTDILPFHSSTFDLVLSIEVLPLLKDISPSISDIYRVLREGGKIIVCVINKESWLRKLCRMLTFTECEEMSISGGELINSLKENGFRIKQIIGIYYPICYGKIGINLKEFHRWLVTSFVILATKED